MQWLIDLIIETIGVPPCYIDRGDPAAPDFDDVVLVDDSAWHELDLSGIIPAGASAAHLGFKFRSAHLAGECKFREKGNVNEYNILGGETFVTLIDHKIDGPVKVGTDRIIEYWLTSTRIYFAELTVRGWWL